MAMTSVSRPGGSGGDQHHSDDRLVLIIIFMVITPLAPRGLDAQVPQPAPENDSTAPPPRGVVISVLAGGGLLLNQEPLDRAALAGRLASLFRHGAPDVVFVRGERGLEFREVAEVLDLASGAGVSRIGLMTR